MKVLEMKRAPVPAGATCKTDKSKVAHPAGGGKVVRLIRCSNCGRLARQHIGVAYCKPCFRWLDRSWRLAQLLAGVGWRGDLA